MTPVILLSDLYVANEAEPWLVPNVCDLPDIENHLPTRKRSSSFIEETETLARTQAIPGQVGLEHPIGGLEKDGGVSYDPAIMRK